MTKITRVDVSRHLFHIHRDLSVSTSVPQAGPPTRIDGLNVGVVTLTADRMPPHKGEVHPDGDEILYVVSGRLRITGESDPVAAVEIGTGEASIVSKGEWHRITLLESPTQLIHITPGPHFDYRPLWSVRRGWTTIAAETLPGTCECGDNSRCINLADTTPSISEKYRLPLLSKTNPYGLLIVASGCRSTVAWSSGRSVACNGRDDSWSGLGAMRRIRPAVGEWSLSRTESYAQVAIPGRSFDDIRSDWDSNRPSGSSAASMMTNWSASSSYCDQIRFSEGLSIYNRGQSFRYNEEMMIQSKCCAAAFCAGKR